jgi:hypothetical protein
MLLSGTDNSATTSPFFSLFSQAIVSINISESFSTLSLSSSSNSCSERAARVVAQFFPYPAPQDWEVAPVKPPVDAGEAATEYDSVLARLGDDGADEFATITAFLTTGGP